MNHNLFDDINIDKANTHVPNGINEMGKDVQTMKN